MYSIVCTKEIKYIYSLVFVNVTQEIYIFYYVEKHKTLKKNNKRIIKNYHYHSVYIFLFIMMCYIWLSLINVQYMVKFKEYKKILLS